MKDVLRGPHWDDIYGGSSSPATETEIGEQNARPPIGYHTQKIEKGQLGEISKIQEEVDELSDAHKQGVKILMLCEVADVVGALEHYLEKHCPGFTIKDAQDMARLTRAHKENRSVP